MRLLNTDDDDVEEEEDEIASDGGGADDERGDGDVDDGIEGTLELLPLALA